MSTSLLYQAFGMTGYQYVSTIFRKGKVFFRAKCSTRRIHCPDCGSRNVILQGSVPRTLRMPPLGGKQVYVELDVPRVMCKQCGLTRQIRLGFADPRVTYSRAFERFILSLSRSMTMKDIALFLGIGWDTVKDILKKDLKHRYGKVSLAGIRYLAIDEISVKKGHKYKTIVMNLETGVVVYVGEGKGADALDDFWKRLGKHKKSIQAVSIDLSQAYTSAVQTHLPKADLVFDHFHLVKLFNDKLSNYRRQLQNGLETKEDKEFFKKSRWLILMNPENLDPEKGQKERLDELLKRNQGLSLAYILKEELRTFWRHPDRKQGEAAIRDWMEKAKASGIRFLEQFAELLRQKLEGILGWFKHRISSGKMEGTNNKIKTMKRQAYGYRDEEFFTLKILALHETKYALVG